MTQRPPFPDLLATIHYTLWMGRRGGGRQEFAEECDNAEQMSDVIWRYDMAALYGLARGIWTEWH